MGKLADAQLLANPELERAIAEDPYDEQRWIVLEDWLLENDDPRGILVRLEKAGRSAGAIRVRRRLLSQLLGKEAPELAQFFFREDWRAGYLRECHFAGNNIARFEMWCRAPATALLRALTLTVSPTDLRRVLEACGGSVFAGTLHDLTISNAQSVPRFGADLLAPFSRLHRLALRGAYLDPPAEVPRIEQLVIAPTRYDMAHVDPMLASARFPRVTELVLDLVYFANPEIPRTTLVAMLDGKVAPALERFEIRNATVELAHEAIGLLSRSPLLPRLKSVALGANDGHLAVRGLYGDAFDHVTVTVPPGF